MSAKPKTSGEAIRSAARKLLEEQGAANLSMHAVAAAAGVRAPSLYKHFSGKPGLLQAITGDALVQLRHAVEKAIRPADTPARNLARMAAAYRAFAKANPQAYRLIFQHPPSPANDAARVAAAGAMLRLLSESMGPERALPAARTLVAFLHGFVSMELDGLFRLGGSVQKAFQFGVDIILGAFFQEQTCK